MTDVDPSTADQPFDGPDLEHFRSKLIGARDELLARSRGRVEGALDEELRLPDEVDQATTEQAQAFELKLAAKDRKLLELIEHALRKIPQGEYGLCEGTGEPIPRARLELRPWARYSVEHKQVLERERAMHVED